MTFPNSPSVKSWVVNPPVLGSVAAPVLVLGTGPPPEVVLDDATVDAPTVLGFRG